MVALKNFLDTMAEMDNYQSIVAQQRSNLGHALGRVNSLTPEDATKLVQALNDLPLPQADKNTLLGDISAKTGNASVMSNRAKLQTKNQP